ncbi:hypothetical protein [Bacillus sp. MRMR6]|uniref:dual OB domain-containing protein n=1 Tax=Bacillus sp. MRMR6 TaxID=1928617 RepID=UPI000952E15D|nr:hypothetical protein [Bacillus sp. MRMR6]OLS33394.1 hypothetical protein BTR25_26080 [Bacillus sp. MRMR6]
MAVTKAFGKYCIAGMTKEGKWIRPVPTPTIYPQDSDRFWCANQITFDGEMVQIGDIIKIAGYQPDRFRFPNHTEDFITNTIQKVKHLQINKLISFLTKNAESFQAFQNTISGQARRSLCIIEINSFNFTNGDNYGETRINILFNHQKYDLRNPYTANGDYKLKDIRWEKLISTNNIPTTQINKMFICLGLATPFNNIEYPMVIGIIPDYEVPNLVAN